MPDIPLTIIANAFDQGNASSIPNEVTQYILSTSNAWGKIGFRRDNISNPGVDNTTINNGNSYAGGPAFGSQIRERWKYAPVSGEPWKGGGLNGGYSDIAREQPLYHYFGFGNGNYNGGQITLPDGGTIGEEMRGYFKRTGYRYNWISGYMTTNPVVGSNMTVSLRWANVNNVPLYDKNWTIKYKIKDAGGTVVQTFNSSFDLFLMYSTDTTVTENLVPTVTCTNCSLTISIEDDLRFHTPIKMAMNTPARNADGSYTLRSGFNIAPGSGNIPPNSNAGTNTTITLPTDSSALNGSGPDPAGGVIQSSNNSSTLIYSLAAGVFIFGLLLLILLVRLRRKP